MTESLAWTDVRVGNTYKVALPRAPDAEVEILKIATDVNGKPIIAVYWTDEQPGCDWSLHWLSGDIKFYES